MEAISPTMKGGTEEEISTLFAFPYPGEHMQNSNMEQLFRNIIQRH